MRKMQDFRSDRRGATAIEYGLIIALIAIAMSTALTQVSTGLATTFGVIGSQFNR